MQYHLLITLALLLFSLPATAQLGIKGGLTVGGTYGSAEEFDGEKIESIDPAIGYQFGITATVLELNAFRLNAELLYEDRRGVKNASFTIIPGPDQGVSSDIKFKNSFTYLSVPLLATFGTGSFNVYIGPSVSYLLSATSESTNELTVITIAGENRSTVQEEIDLINDDRYGESYINRLNVAANIGAMIPLAPKLKLDVRLYHTITDVTNDDEDRSLIDRVTRPQDVRLRDDKDSTVGLQANLVLSF
ncbi:hypothetical protein LEM8419_02563 [Neolewinella maritima]|uniref:Outer membrane protein beta-barrel domain-containing protein n=1 Tax=Neolewinella maritima TaxID=1383882 RepID=A0ABN8F3Y1_9BACT|nr:porin family protein [Neolewinella maritima]CAH1001658.1 hypothetical protein LEM8419_02563 [Neolewinella maritima]